MPIMVVNDVCLFTLDFNNEKIDDVLLILHTDINFSKSWNLITLLLLKDK